MKFKHKFNDLVEFEASNGETLSGKIKKQEICKSKPCYLTEGYSNRVPEDKVKMNRTAIERFTDKQTDFDND